MIQMYKDMEKMQELNSEYQYILFLNFKITLYHLFAHVFINPFFSPLIQHKDGFMGRAW